MNDLQVVAGWLQLGNVQRAMEYIEETKERVRRESVAMNALGPGKYGLLHSLRLRAEGAGLNVTINAGGPASGEAAPTPEDLESALWEAVAAAAADGFHHLELSVIPSNGKERYEIRLLGGGTPAPGGVLSGLAPRGFVVRLKESDGVTSVVLEPEQGVASR
jgi:hypothetical protein